LHGKEREFLHLHLQHASHFQGFHQRKKRCYRKKVFKESKEKEFGCQSFYTDHFSEFGGFLLESKHSMRYPLLDEMKDEEDKNR
jgi:hypothetical protein